MKTFSLVFLFCAFISATVFGAEAPRHATVTAVKGMASVTTPREAGASDLRAGAKVGVGAHIVTTAGAEVTLKFFDGTVAIVNGDSELSIETLAATAAGNRKEIAGLDLKRGGTVVSIDPAKRGITEFSVRTPRGVASARGTVFAVWVTQDQAHATVATMSGAITFITDQGEITVGFGQATTGSGVMSVADAVAANPALAQMFVNAATSIATAIGAGTITNSAGTPNQITTVLAAIVEVAVQAAPNQAAEIARNVVTAAGPVLRANPGALEAIVQAAVQGVVKSDPALVASASTEIVNAVTAAARSASIPVNTENLQVAVAKATATGSEASASSEPILPALDQTQVIVSPSG